MVWECQACGYIHETDETQFNNSTESSLNSSKLSDWACPVCGVGAEFQEEVISRGD